VSASVDPRFGKVLLRARERAGLSVRGLARRLGVSGATVLGAEQGRDVRLATLRRYVCELPEVAPHELLGRAATSPPVAGEAPGRSLARIFGFQVGQLTWDVTIRRDGTRRTRLRARAIRPTDARLADPDVRVRLAQLVFRGSPQSRTGIDAALRDLRAGSRTVLSDGCFSHEFSRDRRGGLTYTREQADGPPPPGFGRPGALSQAAPGEDGVSLVVDLPVRLLELIARPAPGTDATAARACAWADAQPLATDESDLAPFLWPAGLPIERSQEVLRVRVPDPEFGLQHGLLWGEGGTERTLASDATPGAAIRLARETAGLSMRDLAAQLGVSPATVAGLEADQDPRRSLLIGLLDALPSLRAEALLPVEPDDRLLTRRELWERQRSLLGLEADEERKTLVVKRNGDAQAVCESLGLRRVRPASRDLRLRYASAAGGRLPTELRAIEEAVALESEDAGLRTRVLSRDQGRVIHEVVVPREQASRGVSYTRRLFTAGFFDPDSRSGHDGAAIVPFHPVRRLQLAISLPRGVQPSEVMAAVHPRVLLDGPCPKADLSMGLHPEGLALAETDQGRSLRLTVEYPLIGFLVDLFWRRT
jgi:transcriptional regulator with XRE-family HTH domain